MTKTDRVGRGLAAFIVGVIVSMPGVVSGYSVEEEVSEFFADTPVMRQIAKCESNFRQFNSDGTPLRGGWGGGMIGVFQFHERIHSAAAHALGYDLATLEGNLGYAQHVYQTSGTAPWNSAKSCWEHAEVPLTIKKNNSKASLEELELKLATLQKLVVQLQKLLAEKKAQSA